MTEQWAFVQHQGRLLRFGRQHLTGLALTIGFMATLVRSWYLGPDSNWDLLYYHLYKSTSLLDGSIFTDVAMTGHGTYLNPLIELPAGVAIRMLGASWGLIVAMAIVQFACYVAVWRLAHAISVVANGGPLLAVVGFVMAITGSGATSIAFTTFGDWAVAALLCESVRRLILARSSESRPGGWRLGAGIGLWSGVATALKLTAAPMVIGLVVGVLIALGMSAAVRTAIAAAIAFLLAAGPWMVYMQVRYSSPLFPFYNGFFGAPSGPAVSLDDTRFGATGPRSIIEFPVEMFRGTAKYSEIAFQDWRLLVFVALSGALAVIRGRSYLTHPVVVTIVPILITSFLVWIVQFGIYRYFLVGEIFASLLIPLTVHLLVDDLRRTVAVCVALLVVGAAFQQAPDWGRNAEFSSPSLRAAIGNLGSPPSLLVFSAPPPTAYLMEDVPNSTAATSLWSFESGQVLYAGQIKEELDELLSDAIRTESLAVIVDEGATTLLRPLDQLALERCQAFTSNGRAFQLCVAVEPG